MGAAMRGLTRRGLALLAVGAGIGAGAWYFGQRDLLRVAVLLLVLPLASVALVSISRYRIACARLLNVVRIDLGDSASVTLRVVNASSVRCGLVLVEDEVPPALGTSPRLVLDRIEPGGQRNSAYSITGRARGRFEIGPVELRLMDPFGLVTMSRRFTAVDHVLVTPRVHPLSTVPLGGELIGRGDSRLRALATSGEDDLLPREYRIGDEVRRVHWQATARTGDLMVRREERPWQARAAIIIDSRARAHDDESFEWSLSMAASIGVHLAAQGWGVRLLGPGGHCLAQDEHGQSADLLTALALMDPDPAQDLGFTRATDMRLDGDGLVIAILGTVTGPDTDRLASIGSSSRSALAILPGGSDDPMTALTRTGWRVVARDGRSVSRTWADAGALSGASR